MVQKILICPNVFEFQVVCLFTQIGLGQILILNYKERILTCVITQHLKSSVILLYTLLNSIDVRMLKQDKFAVEI